MTARAVRLATLACLVWLTACATPAPIVPPEYSTQKAAPPQPASASVPTDAAESLDTACRGPAAYASASAINASSLRNMVWEPYRREEVGWETYVPVIAREIDTRCPPDTAGFAAALAKWQPRYGLAPDGVVSGAAFTVIKGLWQERRPFVMEGLSGYCPDPPDPSRLAWANYDEGFYGKPIQLRAGALEAFRRMRAAARAEIPGAMADPQVMTLFSGYRDPAADDARCEAEKNCMGITRARCSAHRTGLAMDIMLGYTPGYMADSSADENRLFISRTVAYRWMVANAARFGLVNYVFEPWHWEWTGEAP